LFEIPKDEGITNAFTKIVVRRKKREDDAAVFEESTRKIYNRNLEFLIRNPNEFSRD